jgi:hypothetical protein
MASDLVPEWNEFDWMGDLSRETGLPGHLHSASISGESDEL